MKILNLSEYNERASLDRVSISEPITVARDSGLASLGHMPRPEGWGLGVSGQ